MWQQPQVTSQLGSALLPHQQQRQRRQQPLLQQQPTAVTGGAGKLAWPRQPAAEDINGRIEGRRRVKGATRPRGSGGEPGWLGVPQRRRLKHWRAVTTELNSKVQWQPFQPVPPSA